jgi:cystathionine beta-lyase
MNQFDKKIKRKNTDCTKYDFMQNYFGTNNLQPLWIADMDFATPKIVQKAIYKRVKHPIYAYTKPSNKFYDAIRFWMKEQHNFKIKKEHILSSTSVVASLSAAVEAYSNISDEIIVQPPIYPPFFSVVTKNNRKLVTNPLKKIKNRYYIDFKDLKSKITNKTKILLLCSPHNPSGRVWSKKELKKLVKICVKNNIIIVSDEIHADLVYKKKHIPIANISKKASNITVTLNSCGKSFNLPGITTSYVIAKNKILKDKLQNILTQRVLHETNIFVNEIYSSAYSKDGKKWLKKLIKYLDKNKKLTYKYFNKKNIKIKAVKIDATYLILLDFTQIDLSHKQIKHKLIYEAKVALNDGVSFGKDTYKHFRLNIALNKKDLKIALKKIKDTFIST